MAAVGFVTVSLLKSIFMSVLITLPRKRDKNNNCHTYHPSKFSYIIDLLL
ncbi:hypothetical protein JCM19314_1287 [Nonlabens ulvanivorans]|uniref:Uncharacterized protein n=1 Tax=Nonlabens ulvanivorans TaxID=906888 RepID=A0A090QIB5_NONUL|nr:hypothetical protein JCM19314_1287 [Nonlabens ulvanivorans]